MFKNYQKGWCTLKQEQYLHFALCLAICLHILIHMKLVEFNSLWFMWYFKYLPWTSTLCIWNSLCCQILKMLKAKEGNQRVFYERTKDPEDHLQAELHIFKRERQANKMNKEWICLREFLLETLRHIQRQNK